MKAKYKLIRATDVKGDNEPQPYYARITSTQTISITEMMDYARDYSTFSSSDIKGALQLISELLEQGLRDGYQVELDGIGYFSVSLDCRPVMDKKEIHSQSIRFRQVNFRLNKEMKHRLKTMSVTRAYEPSRKSYTPEEREERLIGYLSRHTTISTRVYMNMNNCTKYQALKDLRQQVKAGRLTVEGNKNCTVYLKCEFETDMMQDIIE